MTHNAVLFILLMHFNYQGDQNIGKSVTPKNQTHGYDRNFMQMNATRKSTLATRNAGR